MATEDEFRKILTEEGVSDLGINLIFAANPPDWKDWATEIAVRRAARIWLSAFPEFRRNSGPH